MVVSILAHAGAGWKRSKTNFAFLTPPALHLHHFSASAYYNNEHRIYFPFPAQTQREQHGFASS
jgi:hypothetical protein